MDSEAVIREICEGLGIICNMDTGTELLRIIKIVFLDAVMKNIKAIIAFKSMCM